MEELKFSIIIPFPRPTKYLYQCLDWVEKQAYRNFEMILLPDNREKLIYPKLKIFPTGNVGPAEKRDIGADKSTGEVLAFIDDDAYPDKNWLTNAAVYFKDKKIVAVCGPGVTPECDNIYQQASGWVNSLWFGSGGAGTYRFTPQKKRTVDDYPSMNFLVRKNDFQKAGGFDTHFWPGEDTKLCHDLVYILKKKIIYDPQVLVYHHRKPLFMPHLQQISRYALHRGHFARILPLTSLRLGYLIPTLFVGFLILGLLAVFAFPFMVPYYFFIVSCYVILLTISVIHVTLKKKSVLLAFLTGAGIFLTHVLYGIIFPVGFLKKSLKQ